ncbi:MAG: Fic family protein [Cyclobacteriaceae bacterium]|nr:Fic family protein [Cyclobacteriaceae bacterium]UYN85155.1 MAG: Fic family protein [Cyclobacteriaceae bacterium]
MIELEQFKAGQYEKSPTGYTYFVPNRVNDAWIWNNPQINSLLEKAALKLGELNSYARLVPNIDLFIQLHVTKEAVISSRIEGTQTRIDEALLSEADIAPERRDDWKEVQNYIKALNKAIKELETLPISSRLIRNTHKILLGSVRGEHKQPGEYRNSQNWIGGTSPADAKFVPPHHQYVDELMGDLENFIHNEEANVPSLIRIAIAHYQFETIHPFLDGNGRIGRLLITLFLVDQGILSKPLLYLSTYFEKNKGLYYDNLTFVRTKHDMIQWIKYFLLGVEETAHQTTQTLQKVLILKEKTEIKININFGRKSNNAIILLNHLFKHPIVDVREVQKVTKVSYKAANDLVNDFTEAKILKETTGQNRNRLFSFDKYLELFIKNRG